MAQGKGETKRVVHYPFIRKQIAFDRSSDTWQDRFNLLSIARNDIYAKDIYLFYFSSIYSKKYLEKKQKNVAINKLTKEDFSRFFLTFVNIFILRSLVGKVKRISGISGPLVNQILEPKAKQFETEEDRLLYIYLKSQIGYQSDIYDNQLFESKKNVDYLTSAEKVQKKIEAILNELYFSLNIQKTDDKIQLRQAINSLKETQIFPSKLSDEELVRYIKNNFKCICNIHCLRRNGKKQVWDEFYRLHKDYKTIGIQFLLDSMLKPKKNLITLPRTSQEQAPVITQFENYLELFPRKDKHQQAVYVSLCKSLIALCNKYNKGTKNYYPDLSINDIFFDQKKLAPIFSYYSLLMNAVGFRGNTKNYELRLATEVTPKGIDYQKSYLQNQKRHLLNEKYYCPKRRGETEEQNNEMAKGKQNENLTEIQQKIHVERLIRILYFIQKHNNFTNDYYDGKFDKQTTKKGPRPFYMKHYEQDLKKIYERLFEKQDLKLQEIVTTLQQIEQEQSGVTQEKDSTLNFELIKKQFGCDRQDTLLEQLKYQSLRSNLYELHLIYTQISALLLGKQSFKNLSNPKKYFFLFFTTKYTQIQMFRLMRYQRQRLTQEQPKYKRKEILEELDLSLNRQIWEIDLNRESSKLKKIIKDASDKLFQYSERKDSNAKYIKSRIEYFQPIRQQMSDKRSLLYFKYLQSLQNHLYDLIQILEGLGLDEKLEDNNKKQNSNQTINDVFQKMQEEIDWVYKIEKSTIITELKNNFSLVGQELRKKPTVRSVIGSLTVLKGELKKTIRYQIDLTLNQAKQFIQKFIQNEIYIKMISKIYKIEQQKDYQNQEFKKKLQFQEKSKKQIHAPLNGQKPAVWQKTCQHYNNKFAILIQALFFLNRDTLTKYQYSYKRHVIGGYRLEDQNGIYKIIMNTFNPQYFSKLKPHIEIQNSDKVQQCYQQEQQLQTDDSVQQWYYSVNQIEILT